MDYLVARGVVPPALELQRRGARGRRLGHRSGGARAGRRAGRQAGAAAAARRRRVARARAAHGHRGRCPATRGASDPGVRTAGGRQRRRGARGRPAARACRLAQLAGRAARGPRARHGGQLGRRHARPAARRDRERCGRRGRVRRLRGVLAAAARAVLRNRDGAPPPPRTRHGAARRGAARRRAICLVHGDYAPKNILLGRDGTWILDAEVAHVGNPVFDLAFFLVFPLLSALQRPEVSAACGEIIAALQRGLRAPRARAAAAAPVGCGTHRRDAAGAHGRPLARDVPEQAGVRARARDRRAHAARPETHDLAALVASLLVSARSIEHVLAYEALDSRGTPTVACVVTLAGGAQGCATCPRAHPRAATRRTSGATAASATAGAACAPRSRPSTARSRPSLRGRDAADQAAIDAGLRALDGTPSLERLGANAVLAASVACALAAADAARTPLWRLLRPRRSAPPAPADGQRALGRRARRAVRSTCRTCS